MFNSDLYQWGKIDLARCTLGCDEEETFTHLFVDCTKVVWIWCKLQKMFWKNGVTIEISLKSLVFNKVHKQVDNIVNLLCLIIKQFIYRCKCNNTLPIGDFEFVQKHYDIECFTAKIEGCYSSFIRKWLPFKPELQCIVSRI